MAVGKKAGRKSQASNDFLEPLAPTIGTATDVGTSRAYNDGAATVTFTANPVGAAATSFTVTASTGQTATGASSPIIVSGLASASTPTFTVTGTNAVGEGLASAASNSITVTTVPAAPVSPTATAGVNENTISWTAPENGGSAITNYYVAGNDGTSGNTASVSIVIADTANTSQYYNVYADNANGRSAASANTAEITTQAPFFPPFFPPSFFAPPGFFAPPSFFAPPNFWFAPPGFFAPPSFKGKCLSPDAVILTTTGWIKAKDLKVGDKAITIDGTHINIESLTSDKTSQALPETVSLTNSEVLSITEKTSTLIGFNYRGKDYSVTQPLFVKTQDGITYKNAGEIEIGEILIKVDKDGLIAEIPVTSIEKDDSESTVYDVRTSPQPWFIVNNFIAIA